jgi:hypothetical protein
LVAKQSIKDNLMAQFSWYPFRIPILKHTEENVKRVAGYRATKETKSHSVRYIHSRVALEKIIIRRDRKLFCAAGVQRAAHYPAKKTYMRTHGGAINDSVCISVLGSSFLPP